MIKRSIDVYIFPAWLCESGIRYKGLKSGNNIAESFTKFNINVEVQNVFEILLS